MAERYLVIEVIDPKTGLRNEYVSLDQEEAAVANGFKALRDSGVKLTGVFSRAERVNGVLRRISQPQRRSLFTDGFRTMSAFLRS